jgi:hypothetical protein
LRKQKALRRERSEQFKSNLLWFGNWVGSGRSGTFWYMAAIVIFGAIGLMWGINTPSVIACKNSRSFCYQLRFDKTQVILKGQVKQVLKKSSRNKNQPP